MKAVEAVHRAASDMGHGVVWWLYGDVSIHYGSPWLFVLGEVLSTEEKPLVYMPALDVDVPGRQLIERWFSVSATIDQEVARIFSQCDWSSPDVLLWALSVERHNVAKYRKLDPFGVSEVFRASDDDGLLVQTVRDNDAVDCMGSRQLVQRFERLMAALP